MSNHSSTKTESPQQTNLKLLLLEDSEDDALLLIRFLDNSNINVESYTLCNSLERFSEEVATNKFDLIISDYNLGAFTGLDAYKIFSEMDKITPFIIVSGAIGEEVAVDAMRAGVNDYVMKDRKERLIPAIHRELNDAKIKREQIRIFKELEIEQDKFRLLVENTPAAIYIISVDGQISYCNDLAVELFGYEKYELTSMQELIPKLFDDKSDRDWVMDFYQKVFDPRQPLPDIDFPMIRTKKGNPKFVKIKTAPLNSDSFILMAEDITHLKLASITLKENQKRLEKIFDTIKDIIIEVKKENNDFIINNVNRSFLIRTGRTRFGTIDQKVDTVVVLDNSINSYLERAVDERSTIYFDGQLKFNSQIRYWEFFASPIFDEDGRLLRIVISVRDLTERNNREIAVRNSEEKFRVLSDLASDIVFEYDIPKNQILWHDGLFKVFGYEKEGIEETVEWINSKIHVSDRGRILESLQDAFKKKKLNWSGEYRMQCKNGEFKDVITKSHIYYDGDGRAIKTIGVTIDYSYKQKAEELRINALVEGADNERNELAKELHDNVGQNLTFVSILLDQLNKKYDRELVQGALKLLNKTIEETRNLSHLLMPKAINDYGVKAAILSQLETLSMSKKYDLSTHFNFDEDRMPIKIEKNLYRIFQQIVANIVKHANAHTIHIQMKKTANSVTLSVEDDGIGFDTDQIALKGGVGLKNIENRVYLLKGNLIIDSAPGKGTFINIDVPLI